MTTRPGDSVDAPGAIDVAELVDREPLGRFRIGVFALVGACLAMDGFDVQAMGYVAPAIIRDWMIPKADMGPVFSAGLAGLFAGSLCSGLLADRIGRRPVLLGATAWFALATLATALASSVPQLVAVRLVAGVGLGAMMPNATALVGEYSPARRRLGLVMIVTNGFMVGAVAGGFASAWLIPRYGWRSVFLVGGSVPLATLAAMAAWLPESLQFLAARGASQERIRRWATRIAPVGNAAGAAYVARELPAHSLAVLFDPRHARLTVLLWVAGFMNVLVAFFIASWLPEVLREGGLSTATSVLVGTVVQLGGLVGTFALGAIAQRVGIVALLTACFTTASVTLPLVARPAFPLVGLVVAAFALGWGVFGGQPGLNAVAATCYPTSARSTGLGAALAVGRFGAILGPLVAGALMRGGWSNEAIFRAAAAPAVVAVVAVLLLRRVVARAAAPPRVNPTSRRPARFAGSS